MRSGLTVKVVCGWINRTRDVLGDWGMDILAPLLVLSVTLIVCVVQSINNPVPGVIKIGAVPGGSLTSKCKGAELLRATRLAPLGVATAAELRDCACGLTPGGGNNSELAALDCSA